MLRRDLIRRCFGGLAAMFGFAAVPVKAKPKDDFPEIFFMLFPAKGQVTMAVARTGEWAKRKDFTDSMQCDPPEWTITEIEELGLTVAIRTQPFP